MLGRGAQYKILGYLQYASLNEDESDCQTSFFPMCRLGHDDQFKPEYVEFAGETVKLVRLVNLVVFFFVPP